LGVAVLINILNQSVFMAGLLGNFRELAKHKQNSDSNTCTGHCKVDKLDIGEVISVLAGKEELRGNEGTDERSDAVPRLAELETSGSSGRGPNDSSIRVGSGLKGSKTAGNNQSACAETTKRSGCALGAREVGSRPEHNRTDAIESETHKDSDFVTLALHNLSCDGGEEEVTTTEVHDLKTGRLEFGDSEDILEMLVKDIEETVGESPEKEERCDQTDRIYQFPSGEVTTLDGLGCDWYTTTCHCGQGSFSKVNGCTLVVSEVSAMCAESEEKKKRL